MSFITVSMIDDAAKKFSNAYGAIFESNNSIKANLKGKTDIFLSHNYKDKVLVKKMYAYLTLKGFSVYVDWIEDGDLNRECVDIVTADRLKKRLKQCSSLLYFTSTNSTDSKWMPWECGFFDGYSGKVAVLPVVQESTDVFNGVEFLNLYPKIEIKSSPLLLLDTDEYIIVNYGKNSVRLKEWIEE